MPTTWSDLPSKIRKMIIDYVIAGHTVHYTEAKYLAAELAGRMEMAWGRIPERPPKRLRYLENYHRLFLVSKQFLAPADLNDAILRHAVIKYHRPTDLLAMNSSFGEGAIAKIKRLVITTDCWQVGNPVVLPCRILDQMKSLEQILAPTKYQFAYTALNVSQDYLAFLEIALGHDPEDVEADEIRDEMTYLFWSILRDNDFSKGSSLLDFLNQPCYRQIERIIEFKVLWSYESSHGYQV